MGILDGFTVLDFTQFLSGPTCTMMLSDMGATVIKVERPNKELSAGPYLGGERTYDLSVMRGKKSISINMKDEEQRGIFLEIAKKADLVVENFKPGTMKKMGIPYEEIQKVNPNVLFASISGYGQYGPLSSKGALDLVIQAASGIMSVTGENGHAPLKVGVSGSDLMTGLYTAVGIMAMIYHKKRTGEGQRLDMAMMDAMIPCLDSAVIRYCASGEVEGRKGNTGKLCSPDGLFPTKDGSIVLTAEKQETWQALCSALGCSELLKDPRFAGCALRHDNAEACNAAVAPYIEKLTTTEAMTILGEAGIPCCTVRTICEVVEDEQIIHRGMIAEVEHPTAGKYRLPGTPLNFSKTPNRVQCAAPVLGADTREIMKSVGYTDADVDRILAEQKPMRKMFVDYPL